MDKFRLLISFKILQGNYTVNGFRSSLKNIPKTLVQNGDYAADVIVWKDDVEILEWRVYVSVINV